MKWISLFLFFCWSIHAENLGIAPLDPDYESKFYSIYRNHHSQQMSISEWGTLINQKNVNTYSMQKGDNLWDISRMLFGNSNHWPKLWSVNADLSNPHRVAVGYKVQVIMGSEGQVPRAVINGQTVNQGVSSPAVGETPSLLQQQGSVATDSVLIAEHSSGDSACVTDLGIILYKAGSTSVYDSEIKCKTLKKKLSERKVKDIDRLNSYFLAQQEEGEDVGIKPFTPPGKLGTIPNSLPPVKIIPAQGIDIVGLERSLSTSQKNVVMNYQVDVDDFDIVGDVFDMPDGISVPTSEIIVELDVPANTGDVFSVIHPLRKVSTQSIFISGPVGYEVIFQAQVKVTGVVPNREGLYFVEVMNMYSDLNTDSKIIREAPSVFDLHSSVRSGQVRAQITAIPRDESALALTVHSFIYLNRGSNDNVNVGDTFSIQANPRFHDRVYGKSLGRVLIVHTAGDFSTGFVTHLKEVAYPGDYLDPLDSVGYTSDAEEDDIYKADEADDFIYNEEEEEFTTGGDDVYEEEAEIEPQEQPEDDFNEIDSSSEEFTTGGDDVYEEEAEIEPQEQPEDDFNEIDSSSEEFILEGSGGDTEFAEEPVLEEDTVEESDVPGEFTSDDDVPVDAFESSVDDGEGFVEEEETSSDEGQSKEDGFLDDFEDEELEWSEE